MTAGFRESSGNAGQGSRLESLAASHCSQLGVAVASPWPIESDWVWARELRQRTHPWGTPSEEHVLVFLGRGELNQVGAELKGLEWESLCRRWLPCRLRGRAQGGAQSPAATS